MKISTIIYKIILFLWKINPVKKVSALIMKMLHIPVLPYYKDFSFNGCFSIKIKDVNIKMYNDHAARIENEIFWKGINNSWEKETLKIWMKFCIQADVIIDIGANTGIYTLIASAVNKSAAIFSFEPSIKVFGNLSINLIKNKIDPSKGLNIAVSDKNGRAEFYDYKGGYNLAASLNLEKSLFINQEMITYEVETKRIDTFIEENDLNSLDLVKIDVELHEPEVIIGFGKYIDVFKPVIIIEVLTNEIADKLNALFKAKGYLFFSIDEDKGLKESETIFVQSEANLNWLLLPFEKKFLLKSVI